ncbi:serine/threonine-protein kinase HipA [Nocardioides daedukensis]|uniref:Serine/threonine-protein kinase HipA n=1 Tax=Nocardioides daedukensis TaxID=634462 RepID=A0A7Y9UVU7_9ACTN|nr:HipA domain-containing protein [Nocardioides daedukensis]NYG59055.1 serine/threonine-protein kinase HipA [Nocardioides daedukensis]
MTESPAGSAARPGLDFTQVDRADVYKSGLLAAHLTRTVRGVEFAYTADWIANAGAPVATTLPVTAPPVISVGGAVPAFFAGLLPEGRRLSALRRSIKTSADDELSLLLGVGSDPIGDVQVVAEGATARRAAPAMEVTDFEAVDFAAMLADLDIHIDRVGLPGVQEKASLAMVNMPLSAAGRSYLVKLDPPEFPHLVENEAFFLQAARRSRIDAADARVVHDHKGRPGLLVTRFDRVGHGDDIRARAVEDGCQVRGLHPEAKYRSSTEEVLGALVRVCAAPRPAALEFLRQAIFAYLTGNGDAHAKNFSVLADGSGRWAPSPAYDLPTSQPYGDNTLALRVAGKNDGNITGARYVELGQALGLPDRAARRAVRETALAVDGWIDELDELPFDAGVVRKLRRVISRRRSLLLEH